MSSEQIVRSIDDIAGAVEFIKSLIATGEKLELSQDGDQYVAVHDTGTFECRYLDGNGAERYILITEARK